MIDRALRAVAAANRLGAELPAGESGWPQLWDRMAALELPERFALIDVLLPGDLGINLDVVVSMLQGRSDEVTAAALDAGFVLLEVDGDAQPVATSFASSLPFANLCRRAGVPRREEETHHGR